MRVYIVQPRAHHKNVESIRKMMDVNNLPYTEHNDLSLIDDTYTLAICSTVFFPPDAFPRSCKVIYGPQFFVFPDDRNHPIHKYSYEDGRFFYNTLSQWNKIVHENLAPNLGLKFITCPFGVDIESIKEVPPADQRSRILVYFKNRHPDLLHEVTRFLESKHLEYDLICYGSYSDADYKDKLQNSKFVIWIGSHESQGFAFQETLASNVPILLWNVRSMHDEYSNGYPYNSHTHPLLATTANVWSDECGIQFFDRSELETVFHEMSSRFETFSPRNVIKKHVSLTSAYQNLIEQITN
jgi:glycosyltransferase involved in cell wall biosynthesis